VPERQIAKPALPAGQAYAKDQGAADEDDDRLSTAIPMSEVSLSSVGRGDLNAEE
jgi:hypothetical protein